MGDNSRALYFSPKCVVQRSFAPFEGLRGRYTGGIERYSPHSFDAINANFWSVLLTTFPALHSPQELRLLRLLSDRFPTITAAHVEMMNLSAILALPKGTEHYLSDIHGAYEQFDHILRHASGSIRRRIDETFGGTLSEVEQVDLALLIYYPEIKLREVGRSRKEREGWFTESITALVKVARTSAAQYTRSKVRKRFDPQLSYLLEELLSERGGEQERYNEHIIRSVIELGEEERVIVRLSYLIQSLVVDRLNVIGDIYDRGPAAERVIDRLMSAHDVSIQWGNHDISWMGAAAGCTALMANVVRLALRYATIATLTSGYGINLWALAHFADICYEGDPCTVFGPKTKTPVEPFSAAQLARMHKAITVIQLKLEAQIVRRHPEYEMEDRLLLNDLDREAGTLTLDDTAYPLLDTHWPTLVGPDRAELTPEEEAVVNDLRRQFGRSDRLQEHIRFLYAYGNMFEVRDGNLKFHGCLPVDELGDFTSFSLAGETFAGPALLARFEVLSRDAFFSNTLETRQVGHDAMWYLWCGKNSPLFGRSRMTTFERYVLADPETHKEPKGYYYALRDNVRFCQKVLRAFGADPDHGHIINGHTPVALKRGERPLMAEGKLIIIDGGMSEAYRPVTGIAGYTLVGNAHALVLAAHEPFTTAEEMVVRRIDPAPNTEQIEAFPARLNVADTDIGKGLYGQLDDLKKLVDAYRRGVLVERARVL